MSFRFCPGRLRSSVQPFVSAVVLSGPTCSIKVESAPAPCEPTSTDHLMMSQKCRQRALPRDARQDVRAFKAESLARMEARRHSVQCTASKVARAPVKLCSRGASPRPRPRAGRRAAFLSLLRNGTSARALELIARCFEPTDCWSARLSMDGDIVTSSGVTGGCKTVSNAWFGSAFGISIGALAVDF
jgi:hypothetical protein